MVTTSVDQRVSVWSGGRWGADECQWAENKFGRVADVADLD